MVKTLIIRMHKLNVIAIVSFHHIIVIIVQQRFTDLVHSKSDVHRLEKFTILFCNVTVARFVLYVVQYLNVRRFISLRILCGDETSFILIRFRIDSIFFPIMIMICI